MHIKQVMVMGAGAVGGYFGGRLAERTDVDVSFIARGPHLEALQKEGLLIKSEQGTSRINIQAFRNPTHAPAVDLILFTVKSYDTAEAIEQIAPVVSEHTQILTIQNGIENYPQLVEAFGAERVIQGFCKIGAGVSRPGVIAHKAFGEITAGEQDGSESERVKVIEALFGQAKVPIHISSQITKDVWLKFTWNCLLNMVTAAGNVTVDQIFHHKESEQLCYKLFDELQQVAAKEGIELLDKEGEAIIESSKKLKGFETSTYQDRQKGKPMEYEAFTGAVVRLAEKHNIDIPHHQTLYALLKLIDNGG
ncbi:MAG: ketopantoate reductase family protein [Balneolaceae bacterium]|nr:ketopantoate reductase family protein [Balneolaceae bacterium]